MKSELRILENLLTTLKQDESEIMRLPKSTSYDLGVKQGSIRSNAYAIGACEEAIRQAKESIAKEVA
jgi:transcriptional regulator of nitric oxide reductase